MKDRAPKIPVLDARFQLPGFYIRESPVSLSQP